MSFLTISNENNFLKTQSTRLGVIVTLNRGLEIAPDNSNMPNTPPSNKGQLESAKRIVKSGEAECFSLIRGKQKSLFHVLFGGQGMLGSFLVGAVPPLPTMLRKFYTLLQSYQVTAAKRSKNNKQRKYKLPNICTEILINYAPVSSR